MNRRELSRAALTLLVIVAVGCGGGEQLIDRFAPENFLSREFTDAAAQRSSEIRTFYGDSLWQYINGGAERYHRYNFVGVATADYKTEATEITVDIYRFDNAVNAYGLYSMVRPENARLLSLGVEGFASVGSLQFVKGKYLVSLIGYDESDATNHALAQAAEELNKLIPGTTNRPDVFEIFPEDKALRATDRYFAESFLGIGFLTHVYSQSYLIDADTITLFLSQDDPSAKLLEWSKHAAENGTIELVTSDLPFDEGKALITYDAYYGRIIAGLRKGKLVGMVGYSEKHREFLVEWLRSLQ
jgi:hypothetical protein